MKNHVKFRLLPLLALCLAMALAFAGCEGLSTVQRVSEPSETGFSATLDNTHRYPDGSYVPGSVGSVSPSSAATNPSLPADLTQSTSTAAVSVQTVQLTAPASTMATTVAPAPTTAMSTVPPAIISPATAPTTSAATIDETIRSLLAAGLDAGYREIDLSSFLAGSTVNIDQIPGILLRIQTIYRVLLDVRPDYYYLDGSNTLKYEILGGTRLSAIVMVVGIRDIYDSWTSADMVSARLALIAKADEIAGKAAGLPTAWQQLLFIHDTLVQQVSYDKSMSQDTNHAAGALLGGSTLCQGYAQAFQLVAQRRGLEVSIISGTAEGVAHAWNLVRLDGKYYHVDVTFDDPVADNDISPAVFHSHFLRSDSAMESTHAWTRANFPACPTDGATLYHHFGWTSPTREVLKQKIVDHFASRVHDVTKTHTLELLYTGLDVPSDAELIAVFTDTLHALSIDRTYSFLCSVEKNVTQMVLFKP